MFINVDVYHWDIIYYIIILYNILEVFDPWLERSDTCQNMTPHVLNHASYAWLSTPVLITHPWRDVNSKSFTLLHETFRNPMQPGCMGFLNVAVVLSINFPSICLQTSYHLYTTNSNCYKKELYFSSAKYHPKNFPLSTPQ